MVAPRALRVEGLHLETAIETFDKSLFRRRLCSLFEPPCASRHLHDLTLTSGSTMVNFTIDVVRGGPALAHMRSRLSTPSLLQEALWPDFTLARPNTMGLTDLVQHQSNGALMLKLAAIKVTSAVNVVFGLLGAWGLVVFW